MRDLEQLADLSWGKFVGAGIVIAVLYYFTFYDSGATYVQAAQNFRTQRIKEEKKLNETKALIADQDKFEEQVNWISEQFQKALEYLPNDLNMSDLMKAIMNEAKAAGVSISEIRPSQQILTHEFYEELQIDLELRGSFSEIVLFLSNISKIPRIIKIQKVGLKSSKDVRDDGTPTVEFTGQLSGYRYLAEKQ